MFSCNSVGITYIFDLIIVQVKFDGLSIISVFPCVISEQYLAHIVLCLSLRIHDRLYLPVFMGVVDEFPMDTYFY